MLAYGGGVPPVNFRRRAQLADAAVALLASSGVHGVTHRAVDRLAGLPEGTAANYFRSREALLVAAAERVIELHQRDMAAAAPGATATELIADSLLTAATTHRDRYLAIFELRLESLRRPALAETLAGLAQEMVGFTAGHHAAMGLDIAPEAVPDLVALYGGALFTLVSAPPGEVTPEVARARAAAIVRSAGV
jgi:DNA-binding transcriptional regulator YbjK